MKPLLEGHDVEGHDAHLPARIRDLKARLVAEGGSLYDLSGDDPIEPTPSRVRQALADAVPLVSQYPTAAGLPALREAIAGWVRRRFGLRIDPDRHVLPTAGSREAIFHLPLALVNPASARRTAMWGEPGYPAYERGTLFAGGESDPVALTPERRWRLELPALADERLAAACVVWLNYPHNPTGAAVDVDYYRRQLGAARPHELVLASDESDVDLYPDEPPPSLLQAADEELNGVLVAFSLSKRSGMSGYRCGALVGEADLIADQRLLRPNIGTATPELVQRAAIAAWSDDAHAADRRSVLNAKREVLRRFLEHAGLTVSGSDAGFYLWVAAPGGDDAAYAEALLHERVVVAPGRAFGPSGRGWLRIAPVPSVEACGEAATSWSAAIESGRLQAPAARPRPDGPPPVA